MVIEKMNGLRVINLSDEDEKKLEKHGGSIRVLCALKNLNVKGNKLFDILTILLKEE